MSKRAVKPKVESKVKTTSKVVVEPSKRVEEVIVIKKKINPYIDNYSYVETKNILNTNPRFQVVVEHRRKGDILGDGNFEETSYQRQVYSQGGNRPKLPAQEQKLRGNKSEVKMAKQTAPRTGTQTTTTTKKTTRTTTTTKETKTRDKNPVSSTGKKEKVEETTVRRRNEGTGTKTQTKTETKTTSSGLRGQQQSKTSSKTTTTTTKLGDKEEGAKSRSRKREAKK